MMPEDQNTATSKDENTGSELGPKSSNPIKTKRSLFNLPLVLALFAIIIALIAVVESGVFLNRLIAWEKKSNLLIHQNIANEQKNSHYIEEIKSTLLKTESTLKDQQSQIKEAQQTIHQLLANNQKNSRLWILTEVRHLLRLANLSLLYAKDVSGSLILLQTAQQELEQNADSSLVPLQQSLASDILQLKAVPKVNKANIITRLMAINRQIPNLSLFTTHFNSSQKNQDLKENTKSLKPSQNQWFSRWQKMLKDSWQSLSKLVVIRHRAEPILPLSNIQQDTILKNIQLFLSQAQWAALHQDKNIYEFSISQAKQLIKQYYNLKDLKTANVLKELSLLEAYNVAPSFPSLKASQTLVEKLISEPSSLAPIQKSSSISDHMPFQRALMPIQGASL